MLSLGFKLPLLIIRNRKSTLNQEYLGRCNLHNGKEGPEAPRDHFSYCILKDLPRYKYSITGNLSVHMVCHNCDKRSRLVAEKAGSYAINGP